jgi:hypothetical protein
VLVKEEKTKSEIAFQNAMDSLRTNATKTKYAHSLYEYVKFLGLKNGDIEDLSLLLDQNTRDIETGIISYIVHLKKRVILIHPFQQNSLESYIFTP